MNLAIKNCLARNGAEFLGTGALGAVAEPSLFLRGSSPGVLPARSAALPQPSRTVLPSPSGAPNTHHFARRHAGAARRCSRLSRAVRSCSANRASSFFSSRCSRISRFSFRTRSNSVSRASICSRMSSMFSVCSFRESSTSRMYLLRESLCSSASSSSAASVSSGTRSVICSMSLVFGVWFHQIPADRRQTAPR